VKQLIFPFLALFLSAFWFVAFKVLWALDSRRFPAICEPLASWMKKHPQSTLSALKTR